MRRILFTDDEPRILDGLRRMLRGLRREWDMVFSLEGQAAVAELETSPFDVVVTDMRMPGMDGVEVLSRAQRVQPEAVRIVLSGHSDKRDAARAARVAHQFLVKPSSPGVVRGVIERLCAVRAEIPPRVRAAVGGIGSFPVVPGSLDALNEVLHRSDAPAGAIAQIIGRDPGMAAKLLQVVNSSFFGISREVMDVPSAVRLLGPGLIHELVTSGEVFRPFADPPSDAFSIHAFQARSIAAAEVTAREEAAQPHLAVAALLHKIGELVLADTMPGEFAEAVALARSGGLPPQRAEAEVLGATHAQVGAYLLELWSLPPAVVELVERPPVATVREFAP